MATLKLVANPTFLGKVGIPVAGADPALVEFTFKHRTKTALDEFIKSRADQSDADSVMDMVDGWDLEDVFCKESVELLIENYIGAPLAIFDGYLDHLVRAKTKN